MKKSLLLILSLFLASVCGRAGVPGLVLRPGPNSGTRFQINAPFECFNNDKRISDEQLGRSTVLNSLARCANFSSGSTKPPVRCPMLVSCIGGSVTKQNFVVLTGDNNTVPAGRYHLFQSFGGAKRLESYCFECRVPGGRDRLQESGILTQFANSKE